MTSFLTVSDRGTTSLASRNSAVYATNPTRDSGVFITGITEYGLFSTAEQEPDGQTAVPPCSRDQVRQAVSIEPAADSHRSEFSASPLIIRLFGVVFFMLVLR
jgi:hypothetical protein